MDITRKGSKSCGCNLQMPGNLRFFIDSRTILSIKKGLVLMLTVIKVFLSLLSIMHGNFSLGNQLFHLASEVMSMRVDVGFSRQKKVNRKQNVFTIKDFKWCFGNTRIDSIIDSYFSKSHIVRPVLLVFIEQLCTKVWPMVQFMHFA